MPSPVFTDENGYRRWAGDGKLVHRGVAYKKIYLPNKDSYPLPFSEYVVHHKDENKKNNDVSNLQIVTQEEHERIHGFAGMSLSEGFSEMLVDRRVHWLLGAGAIWYASGMVLADLFGEESAILIIPKILLGIFIVATIITAWVPNVKLKKYAQICVAVLYALVSLAFFRMGFVQEINGVVIFYSRWLYLILGVVFGFVAFFKFRQKDH